MWSRVMLYVWTAGLLAGCAVKKPAVEKEVAAKVLTGAGRSEVLASILQHQVYYRTFSGRAKANVSVNQEQYDATVHLRIIRDEAIWVSVTALMGIEVARMKITPDSVLLMNRLQRSFLRKPFTYLVQYMGESTRFRDLQDLVTGNTPSWLLDQSSESVLTQKGNRYSLVVRDGRAAVEAAINEAFRMDMLLLHQQDHRYFRAGYADYESVAGQHFPRTIDVSVKSDNLDMAIVLRYERIRYDEAVEMPFVVPDSYRILD